MLIRTGVRAGGRAPYSLLCLAFGCAFAFGGCGDDSSAPTPEPDGGSADAGDEGRDAGGPRDGGHDAGGADAAPDTDAGPGGDADVPVRSCEPTDAAELFRDPDGGEIGLGAAGGPEAFAVAWTGVDEGTELLSLQVFSSDGTPQMARSLASDASVMRQPEVAWAGDGWLVAWAESSDGKLAGYEVRVRALKPDGSPRGEPRTATDNALQDTAPALVRDGDRVRLAYVQRDPTTTDFARVRVQTLDLRGAPTGEAVTVSPDTDDASAPALALPDGEPIVGWIDVGSEGRRVRIHPIEGDGSSRGEVRTMSSEPNVFGRLAFATRSDRAAMLFDVAPEPTRRDVRFRATLPSGAPLGSEKPLTRGSRMGVSPDIGAFAGGFAAVWRAGRTASWHLRLTLLDLDGEVAFEEPLVGLHERSGGAALALSGDGRLFAAWTDSNLDGESSAHAAVIHCRADG